MVARTAEELIAWQLAVGFREAVSVLLARDGAGHRDFRYESQLRDAMASTESNIVEGFHRCSPGQFVQFLSYARASHAEAETRLKQGIARSYFSEAAAQPALRLAKRCCLAILRLLQSQQGRPGPSKPSRPQHR